MNDLSDTQLIYVGKLRVRTLNLIRWMANLCIGGEKDAEPRMGFVAPPRKAAAVIVCGPSLISVEFHGIIVYGGPEAR